MFSESTLRNFWAKVDKGGDAPSHNPALGPCWLWTAYLKDEGYGQFRVVTDGRSVAWYAHRLAYTIVRGPIPDGLKLDHLCHDPTTCQVGPLCPHRACVNPEHLEPVTDAENMRRGLIGYIAADDRCARGHVYGTSDGPKRRCRQCRQEDIAAGLPEGDPRHGASGYATYKCRCDVCREAHRLRARDYAARVGGWR